MQRPNGTGSIDRSARVNLIKRVIIGFVVAIVVLPTLLCIILFCRLGKLEKELKELTSAKEEAAVMTSAALDDGMQVKRVGEKNPKEPYTDEIPETDISEEIPVSSDTGVSTNNIEETDVHTDWPKKVYLTFDDGPSSNTDDILDILNQYGVKGNFFVVATDSESLQGMYKRIVDEGHVIGMHSYSHKYQEVYASRESFINDLSKIQSLVYEKTGYMPDIYRFPGGSSNLVSNISMSVFINVLDERGITYYDWNVSSQDASNPMLTKEQIVDNCLYDIQEYEEAMILMHDLGNKTSTVEALPELIERLQKMGVEIAPIDENTMHIQHTNIQ